MPLRRSLVLALAWVSLAGDAPSSQHLSAVDLLDRYAAGHFEAVVRELSGEVDFRDLLKQLQRDGAAWADAEGPAARPRRELAAATFALEAARVDAWNEWKWIARQPPMEDYQPFNVLYWQPPPLLIEWGCALLRRSDTPRPVERWWHLAAISVAQRAEDPQCLVGDPAVGRGMSAGEIGNTEDEIKHLDHAIARFPRESRFWLAQGIARDRVWPDDALRAYTALAYDPDVGGEAVMRLGAMQMGQNRIPHALGNLARAETLTRDPYVVYLSRYFRGRILQGSRQTAQAIEAYRGAVAAVPHAPSATIPLAVLLFRDGRRTEAHELIGTMLAATPAPRDPWREFVHADDRYWPELIVRLREAILR